RYLLVSNSDAHSPAKLGREANIFETAPDYPHMIRAMTTGEGFAGTVEFYPEEGKYHLDGHRKCGIRLEPEQTLEHDGVCPECGKPLTLGVLYRVAQLADRQHPKLSKAFFSLIPLTEVLSELLSCGPNTKKVATAYETLLNALGPEIHILMECPLDDVAAAGGPLFSEALDRMRTGRVIRDGGYDGEYGAIRVFEKAEMDSLMGQTALFPGRHKIKPPRKKRARLPKVGPKKPMPLFGGEPIPAADPVLDTLNMEQRAAVTHRGGHLLVKAGPGTGKTLTLTHRIAWLIREGKARPDRMLALTFTRKAAREMARRIEYLAGREAGESIRVATFHRLCLDILRTHGGRIEIPSDFILASEADAVALCRHVAQEAGAGRRLARKFMKALPAMKMAAALGLDEISDPAVSALFDQYRETLKSLHILDLDDLECEALRLFRSCPEVSGVWGETYPWLFVDEYQDTNMAQVEILKALVRSGAGAICAIGDPDQAIYGFRGALVENFHRFETDFSGARVVALTRNYRSTSPILESAAAVMRNRALEPLAPGGSPLFVAPCRTEGEEAEMIVEQVERLIGGTSHFSLDSGRVDAAEGERDIGFGDLAVLFRLNAQGNALAEALDRAGIPFSRSGERPLISRFPVDVVWRFLQTLLYPENVHFERMYGEALSQAGISRPGPARDVDPMSPISEIIERAVAYHNLVDLPDNAVVAALKALTAMAGAFKGGLDAFLDTLSLERGIDHESLMGDRVALMSLHAAKGLEWPVVFITGCEDGLLPCTLFGGKDMDEERRLFFVGMTRARNRLILSHAARRSLNGRVLELTPSPFLQFLPAAHVRPLERRAWKPKGPAHKQLGLFE
ncbi:MAG: UvrD-helicase domain-containing protein, partial [Deltaproteobacteria bacterium]|nr:UvrD-helicase domain-containing protein [Deltaproteobacteria bacterium]